MIIFACNAGAKAGFGHLVRCRALASRVIQLGGQCLMLGPSKDLSTVEDDALFREWLPVENWETAEEQARHLLNVAKQYGATAAVIDDYRADNRFQKVLFQASFPWLQFDTSIDCPHYPTVLVNPSPGVRHEERMRQMINKGSRLLLGPQFAILRPEFDKLTERMTGSDEINVLLTFGAGGDGGAIIYALEALAGITKAVVKYTVVSGIHNPNNLWIADWIKAQGCGQIDLKVNPPRMSDIYAGSDIALMSGGTSVYEAAACGAAMLLMPIAENQVKQSKAWAQTGAAIYLGLYGHVPAERLIEEVSLLVRDAVKRAEMSAVGQRLVDGDGAIRVAKSLMELSL